MRQILGVVMSSPDILDIPKLIEPIPGAKPTGEDLRLDPSPNSSYQAVKQARNAARVAERQLLTPPAEGEEVKLPEWRPVLNAGVKVLREQSKDLEVTAYVIEALLRLHGFDGLHHGFQLARELVERFWDNLYPTPDEDGVATRVAPLVGLNGDEAEGTLILPMSRVDLTDPQSMERLTLVHYQEAVAFEKISDPKVKEKRTKEGALTLQAFQKAVAETPPQFYVKLVADLQQCQKEYAALGKALAERCGNYSVPSSAIRAALEKMLDTVNEIARGKLPSPAVKSEPAAARATAPAPGAEPAASNGVTVDAAGAIRSREEAFRTLLKVAEYFRAAEPHSVVSYSLEQIVGWGRMPLPDLLAELLPDDAARKGFFKMVGIRGPEPPPKEAPKK